MKLGVTTPYSRLKIVVFTKPDYSESTTIFMKKGLTKDQITNRVNQKIKEWYYLDILKEEI